MKSSRRPLFVFIIASLLFATTARAEDGALGRESSGPWYYELTGEAPADEVVNGVTWTYFGQHVFDDPDYTPPLDERDALTGEDLQMAAVKVDNLGREWRVAGIDPDAMQAAADEYAKAAEADFDFSYAGWSVAEQLRGVRDPAKWEGDLVPTAWSSWNCDGSAGNDMWVWEDESRVESVINGSSSNAIQSTVALIQDFGGGATQYVCSGAFVDSDGKVLTAAHCVTNPANGDELDPNDFQVCTRGNHYTGNVCYGVTAIVADPSFAGENWQISFANDLAVMSVSIGSDTIHHLALSTNTTAELESSNKASNAYPEWIENGSGDCLQNQPGGLDTEQLFFRESSGEVVAATTGLLKTRLDTTKGASGGSITHTDSGVQVHAAVIDGYSPTPTAWSGGARTSANTSFINSNP